MFDPTCDLGSLKSLSLSCDLCRLLFEALEQEAIKPPGTITLRQNGAIIAVENGPNLLSIYVEPGM